MTTVDTTVLDEMTRRLVAEFQPEQIILFGSHARGDAGKYSDVDLLVLMPFEGKSYRKATEIRRRVRPDFPVHLVVRTPEVVEERIALGDFFLQEAVEEGKILHESRQPRVGRQS